MYHLQMQIIPLRHSRLKQKRAPLSPRLLTKFHREFLQQPGMAFDRSRERPWKRYHACQETPHTQLSETLHIFSQYERRLP